MKQYTIVRILLLMLLVCTLINSGMSQGTISAEYANVLYAGLDNPVKVAVFEYKSDEIELKTNSELKIKKHGNGYYIFYPEKPGEARIEIIDKKTNHTIDLCIFRIKYPPVPVVTQTGTFDSTISKRDFLQIMGITTLLADFPMPYFVTLQTFKLSIIRKGEVIHSEVNEGGRFNDAIKQNILKIVQVDDIISISDILAKDSIRDNMSLYDRYFTVVN